MTFSEELIIFMIMSAANVQIALYGKVFRFFAKTTEKANGNKEVTVEVATKSI